MTEHGKLTIRDVARKAGVWWASDVNLTSIAYGSTNRFVRDPMAGLPSMASQRVAQLFSAPRQV